MRISKALVILTVLVTVAAVVESQYLGAGGIFGAGGLSAISIESPRSEALALVALVLALFTSLVMLTRSTVRVADATKVLDEDIKNMKPSSEHGRYALDRKGDKSLAQIGASSVMHSDTSLRSGFGGDWVGESSLVGNTLRAYWSLVLRRSRPMGLREMQRELGFSSPSSAVYQLDKLVELGLVERDDMGDYVVCRIAKVGPIRNFFFLGRTAVSKNAIYCVSTILISAACFVLLLSIPVNAIVYLAMLPGLISSAVFWYEAKTTVKYVRNLMKGQKIAQR